MKRIIFLLLFAASLTAQPVFDDTYERILVPVFLPVTPGAFGSEFHSQLTVWNKSQTETLRIFGVEEACRFPITCPAPDPGEPVEVRPYGSDPETPEGPILLPNGSPGRFIYVPKTDIDLLAANLRVFDNSRSQQNYGTQIPLARQRDFSSERIVLPDVPMSSPFRNTLRIYSAEAATVVVSFEGPYIIGSPVIIPPGSRNVTLRPGVNVFDPAYAVVTNFAPYPRNLTVVVEPLPPCAICPLPHIPPAIWAFISVTNNDTQAITTIFPN